MTSLTSLLRLPCGTILRMRPLVSPLLQPPKVMPPPPVRHVGDEGAGDVVTKMTRDRRFRQNPSATNNDIGPGAYSTGVTMHKKSFNITFSQTKKL